MFGIVEDKARTVEDSFGYVRVRGEISGFKRHASGHCYFALKDAEAVLDAVCWRMTALRLGLRPEDGMEVVCNGRLTTYPGRSKYQLVVDSIELAGKPFDLAIRYDCTACRCRTVAVAGNPSDGGRSVTPS